MPFLKSLLALQGIILSDRAFRARNPLLRPCPIQSEANGIGVILAFISHRP